MFEPISAREFHAAEGTADWRVIGDGATAFFGTVTFGDAVRLVEAIGGLPGLEDHRPDVDVRHDGVTVRLLSISTEWYGMSREDVELARQISAAARELSLAADPGKVQSMVVIPGATLIADVVPFWQAALGYDRRPDSPDEDLVDPRDRNPGFWFEAMEQPRADGGGAIHVAVWVPPEAAEARVAAALAAGGRMVRDDFAPAWWTLADVAGNEVDIATVLERD
jgi:4a-hydroxytetrahydrobiopterin dehydratase